MRNLSSQKLTWCPCASMQSPYFQHLSPVASKIQRILFGAEAFLSAKHSSSMCECCSSTMSPVSRSARSRGRRPGPRRSRAASQAWRRRRHLRRGHVLAGRLRRGQHPPRPAQGVRAVPGSGRNGEHGGVEKFGLVLRAGRRRPTLREDRTVHRGDHAEGRMRWSLASRCWHPSYNTSGYLRAAWFLSNSSEFRGYFALEFLWSGLPCEPLIGWVRATCLALNHQLN